MLEFEYGHGLIFELILAQRISGTNRCLSMNVYSIVTGL